MADKPLQLKSSLASLAAGLWPRGPLPPVERQLIENLYLAGLPTLVAGEVTAVVSFLAFGGLSGGLPVVGWMLVFSLLTAIRFWRIGVWRGRQPWDGRTARRAANEYRLLTLLSGIAWSYPLTALSFPIGSIQQIYALVITIGMPVAAMPANSIFMPVYRCFEIPLITALLYWTISVPPALNAHFAFVAAIYGFILYLTARIYSGSLRATLKAQQQNQQLISELSSANKQLEGIAYLDPLTGLANRRWFQLEANRILRLEPANGRQAALLLIDMDNFKQVNDRLGHTAGDRLLVTIADRLKSALRLNDISAHKTAEVSRYGGDEFMVLLVDADGEEGARKAVTRILRRIGQPVALQGVEITPSVSIGIAMAPEDGNELDTLIRGADLAMYQAKQSGRNRFCFYRELDGGQALGGTSTNAAKRG